MLLEESAYGSGDSSRKGEESLNAWAVLTASSSGANLGSSIVYVMWSLTDELLVGGAGDGDRSGLG